MRFILLLLMAMNGLGSFAQSISGKVYDHDNQPLSSVIIKLYGVDNQLKEFTQTDIDGNFTAKSSPKDVHYLVLSKLGFDDFRIDFESLTAFTFSVQLSPTEKPVTYLEEVVVKAPERLYNSLDTLTYKADSLRNQNVTTVEDLISRIPGVSIDINTGRISYQNKPISTILIDGDNLTGNNYQIFSKNISEKIAQEVQLIDGFEENSFLKQFKRSDAIALNIKTNSEEKGIYSGSISAGGGYQDRYVGSGNLLFLSETSKNLLTSTTNNLGDFSFGQQFALEQTTVNDRHVKSLFYNVSRDFLSKINPVLSMNYNQNLSENEEFFVSDNLQFKSGKSEFLLNSFLYKDVLSQNKADFFLIKNGTEQTLFVNTKEEESTPSNWGLSLNHNFKLSDKFRLENQLLFNRKSFDEISLLNLNETVFENELGENDLFIKSDIFIKPSSKYLIYSYNSFKHSELTDVFTLAGESIFTPETVGEINFFEQEYFSKNTHFNNTSGVIQRKGSHDIFEFATQFDYHNTDNIANNTSRSDFKNKFYNFSIVGKWTKVVGTRIFEAGLKNTFLTGNNLQNKFVVLPNLRYKWKNIYTNFDAHLYRELVFVDNKYWINGSISTGFQSFINSSLPSSKQFFSTANVFKTSLNHSLKSGSVDLGIQFQASYTPLNFIPVFSAEDNFFVSGVLPFDADDYSVSTSFEISKYVSGLTQNFRIVPSHAYSKTIYASNEDVFRNESNVFSIRFETKTAYDGWFNFFTGFTFKNQVFSDSNIQMNEVTNSSNHFSSGFFNLNLIPITNKLKVQIQNNLYDFNTGGTYFYLGDIQATYKPEKFPLEIQFKLKNFTDERRFSLFSENASTISRNSTFVRPLSAVLSLKYVF
ncbi:MAG: carboxypeptidase regulatory-like domain-containing protein [Flavobacteriaceae bacterium]|nr:carboxypeptidase regulatory-like domain-containing protein [Flavobacteriaceae bacterium]